MQAYVSMRKSVSPIKKHRVRILLVEDEAYLRDIYREILGAAGYIVDEAEDGEEALDALEQGGYDLVLLDIMLPKLDGIEVLRRLKEINPTLPNGPVVIFSNLEQEDILSEGLALGARSYIVKSDVSTQEILNEISRLLPT